VGIYQQAADGSGEPRLVHGPQGTAEDVSSDGIVVINVGVPPESDIRTISLAGGAPSDFLATRATEGMAAFSPDGRWIAYASNESGQDEVYVRPFPRADGVGRRVSVGGGTGPVWAPDGSALYYRGASGDLMALPTTLSPGFTPGRPRALFRFAGIYRMSGTARAYDIHPDGRRFIMVSAQSSTQPRLQVNVVFNWTHELERLVPTN
jgi:serine/threonine-protein kinase